MTASFAQPAIWGVGTLSYTSLRFDLCVMPGLARCIIRDTSSPTAFGGVLLCRRDRMRYGGGIVVPRSRRISHENLANCPSKKCLRKYLRASSPLPHLTLLGVVKVDDSIVASTDDSESLHRH